MMLVYGRPVSATPAGAQAYLNQHQSVGGPHHHHGGGFRRFGGGGSWGPGPWDWQPYQPSCPPGTSLGPDGICHPAVIVAGLAETNLVGYAARDPGAANPRVTVFHEDRHPTIGGVVVSPAEVQASMDAIDGMWSTLGIDAARCPTFANTTPDGMAFNNDFSAWKHFVIANSGAFFTAGTVNDALPAWQQAAADWQQKIKAAQCAVSGITIRPPPKPGNTLETVAIAGAFAAAAIAAAMIFRK